jgi:hypothetical protein
MQVSNSTGQGTDYRLGSSTGGTNCVSGGSYLDSDMRAGSSTMTETVTGQLDPGGSEVCAASGACSVEFMIGGKVVASAYYPKDPGQVVLVEKDGQYSIQTIAADTFAA